MNEDLVGAIIPGIIAATGAAWLLFKVWTTPGADRSTKVVALIILAILVAIVFGVQALFGWVFS